MLSKVARRHEDWVRMVISFGETQYPEDIVQEGYLKLNRYIENGTLKESTINTYFYMILKSIYIDLCRVRKKYGKVCLDELAELSTVDYSEEIQAWEKIYNKIEAEFKEWYWYDEMLFKLYVNTKLSQRDISEGTGIGLGSVHNTLRRCGDKVKEAIEEDIEDIKYKDYERIKSVS